MRAAGAPLLTDVRLFDVYAGPNAPAGQRSLAFTLTFQSADRTLADADIEAAQKAIVEALGAQVGATLRDHR